MMMVMRVTVEPVYTRNISEMFLAPIRDFHQTQYYKFPKPSKININMMPFIVGLTFEDCL